MYELLKEFIKPELLVLVPVLYLIGVALKASIVSDKFIPWILGAVGVMLSFVWLLATSFPKSTEEIFLVIFTGIVQGVLVAGASVYVNQLVKQSAKDE